MKKVLLINGPNLGILGKRQTHIYGSETLDILTNKLKNIAKNNVLELEAFQLNIEGEIVTLLNEVYIKYCANRKESSTNDKVKKVKTFLVLL